MKTVMFLMVVVFTISEATAQEFYLQDFDSRVKYGPFQYVEDATVTLDGKSYWLQKSAHSSVMEQKLRDLIVPSVEFRNAHIIDVIEEFQKESERTDPERRGINMVLLLRPEQGGRKVPKPEEDDPFGDFGAGFGRSHGSPNLPKCTLTLRKISLYDALSVVCEQVGLRMEIGENMLKFRLAADRPGKRD